MRLIRTPRPPLPAVPKGGCGGGRQRCLAWARGARRGSAALLVLPTITMKNELGK